MDKERYIELIENQRKILERSRNLINDIFEKIEKKLLVTEEIEELEDLSGMVNKLSSILLKVVTKEHEIAQIDIKKLSTEELSELSENIPDKIDEVDLLIITEYLKRLKNEEEPPKKPKIEENQVIYPETPPKSTNY